MTFMEMGAVWGMSGEEEEAEEGVESGGEFVPPPPPAFAAERGEGCDSSEGVASSVSSLSFLWSILCIPREPYFLA